MSPASPEELELHRRLVDGDPMACAELYNRYTEDLIEDLAIQYNGIAAHDRDLVSSAVTDAVFDYIAHPTRYRPNEKNLKGYLRMSAVGNLLNLWHRVPGPEKAGWVRSLDEMCERGVCPVCSMVGRLQGVDDYDDSVQAICRAWRHLLEQLPDSSPAELVQILDKGVALIPRSRNSIVKASRDLETGVLGMQILWRLWQRVRERVPDRRERQTFVLMLCGVRETGVYARALELSHLPLREQRNEVKRVKDRVKKRLQRADWSGLSGKEAG
jgi:hypothetical protein